MSIKKHVDIDTIDSIIDAIPSNIFFKDTDLKYVFSSHIWEQVDSGDDEDFDIYGKTDRDIRKDTANLDNVEKSDRKILETGKGTRYTIKSEVDGHTQFLELVKEPVRDKDGNIIGIVGLINDVTRVTEEMADMLENEKAYRQAMKEGALLAYNVNLSKDLLEEELVEEVDGENIKFLDLLGMKLPCRYSDMNKRLVEKLYIGDCQQEYLDLHDTGKLIDIYNSGKKEIVREMKLDAIGMDGKPFVSWIYETVLLMRRTNGDIVAFITVNDITEQRRHEEEVRLQLEENAREAERVANMKSDFLANMSHEIRTPMNAVIGMAEIALREDLPDAARDYLNQIKTSGNALLSIINDVLDFSKIESGKMDIIPDNYDPLSAIHDVSGVVMNRIGEKDIELVANVDPTLPIGLFGDVMRLRQVLINLVNNAIKFTPSGFVKVDVGYDKLSDDEILLKISVTDSGIGIKEEDLKKLFVSFQQVDSKRNRNVEGTGLGLAICSKLVELMNGTIGVTSEYGKGSTFSFAVPQRVTDWTPSLHVKDKDDKVIIGYWENNSVNNLFFNIFDLLGLENYPFERIEEAKARYSDNSENKKFYFITNNKLYTEQLERYADEYPDIQFIVICDMLFAPNITKPNVMFIKKPLSTIGVAMALNNEFFHVIENANLEYDFIAPDAKVLIVDDNEVNLVVAEGLLEPLKMNVLTANGGKKALEMLENESFDIVFMDHMMPEIDGVETTRIIRRLHPELQDMPIIALSANAVEQAREMFLKEGMNDFVAKPIEIKTITGKIRQWLPAEKVKKNLDDGVNVTKDSTDEMNPEEKLVIGDLDIDAALSLVGSQKIYMSILEKYFNTIKLKAKIIKECEVREDIQIYTIEVHALKSSSKQVGAMELSAMAAELEACGKENDIQTIHEKTDAMIERYLNYYDVFKPHFISEEDEADKPMVTTEQLVGFFDRMLLATDDLDMNAMEEVAKEMDRFGYEGEGNEFMESIRMAVANLDVDSIEETIGNWKTSLGI